MSQNHLLRLTPWQGVVTTEIEAMDETDDGSRFVLRLSSDDTELQVELDQNVANVIASFLRNA